MSKYCTDCGCQMDDNAQTCPKCGCPVENRNKTAATTPQQDANADYTKRAYGIKYLYDTEFLVDCKDTEVESSAADCADTIKYYYETLAIVELVLSCIIGAVSLVVTLASRIEGLNAGIGIAITAISVLGGIISYYFIKFIGKLIWSFMRLFVNISATWKRIELILEKNGTD